MESFVIFLSLWGIGSAFQSVSLRRTEKSLSRPLYDPWDRLQSPLRPFVHPSALYATKEDNENDEQPPKKQRKKPSGSSKKKKKSSKRPKSKKPDEDDLKQSKEELVRAVGEKMRSKKTKETVTSEEQDVNLFEKLNPFKAGQSLRKTIGQAISSITPKQPQRSIYYLDDRFTEGGGGAAFTEPNPLLERLEQDDFIPEVLVVGATGEVGRLVVRRLLRDGRFRVRVLVRDLYTRTLNLLGTGVTYCQGDLSNRDSLEYALTDVDKIIFCASAPRPDENQFQQKFEDFMSENLRDRGEDNNNAVQLPQGNKVSDDEWEQLESVLEARAKLAESIDCVGMENLIKSYQDVRHADYGTSQAAKRSLFKFQDRPEDFNLFEIDDDGDEGDANREGQVESGDLYAEYDAEYDEYADDDEYEDEDYEDEYGDEYADYEDDDYSDKLVEERNDASVKTQVQWIRNKFEHGVFVGRVPKKTDTGVGGEAAIVSSRLRSREDPDKGIDLGSGFAGFVCRVCSDGGTYEAFVRTGSYYDDGVEYVCEFTTQTKPTGRNKSRNKFVTVRLPFASFKPVRRKVVGSGDDDSSIPSFRGSDVRNIGFRYRSASNESKSKLEKGDLSSFYLALCYIKLYRSQPEPEFVYLSDARIPPVVRNGMVRHDARQLITGQETDGDAVRLLDESTLKTATQDKKGRIPEETYYKFRGEDILKKSGLSYAIIRVSGYNESPSGEASTIELKPSNENVSAISRDEAAQVCVSALLDPSALNKSFYVGKKKESTSQDEDISSKFSELPADAVV